jgi:hypothetical protein
LSPPASVKLVATCKNGVAPGCPHPALVQLIFTKATPLPDGDHPVLALCEGHWPLWVDEGHKRGWCVWSADLYGPHPGVFSQI